MFLHCQPVHLLFIIPTLNQEMVLGYTCHIFSCVCLHVFGKRIISLVIFPQCEGEPTLWRGRETVCCREKAAFPLTEIACLCPYIQTAVPVKKTDCSWYFKYNINTIRLAAHVKLYSLTNIVHNNCCWKHNWATKTSRPMFTKYLRKPTIWCVTIQ